MKNQIYTIIATFFSVTLIISLMTSSKLFIVPFTSNFLLPVGMITYPLTFFLGNLVTEVYGQQKARFMVYLGFSISLFVYLLIALVLAVPAVDQNVQKSFETVFALNGIIIFGSLLAYLVSQVLEVSLFAYIRELTGGKHLWLRSNLATLISQFVDTFIANWILLSVGMNLDTWTCVSIILACFAYKTVLTVFGTPIFCGSVSFLQNYLNKNEPSEEVLVTASA